MVDEALEQSARVPIGVAVISDSPSMMRAKDGNYLRFLQEHPVAVESLVKDLLINVTSFFRDPEAFAALKNALGRMLRDRPEESQIRVWSAACSTGEEAYSLAMLLTECAEDLGESKGSGTLSARGVIFYLAGRLKRLPVDCRARRALVWSAEFGKPLPELPIESSRPNLSKGACAACNLHRILVWWDTQST